MIVTPPAKGAQIVQTDNVSQGLHCTAYKFGLYFIKRKISSVISKLIKIVNSFRKFLANVAVK